MAQSGGRCHSEPPGGGGDLRDDPVAQVGLALFPARPQHGGAADRHELGDQLDLPVPASPWMSTT